MRNERPAQLPPHCGNCRFHLWEESVSECRHSSVVRERSINTEVDGAEDGDDPRFIAKKLIDAAVDGDWQGYEMVCDHHEPAKGSHDSAQAIAAEELRLAAIITEKIRSRITQPSTGSFQIGDVVRYSQGQTALMRIDEINNNGRAFGIQCMGSFTGAYLFDCVPASAKDIETWNEMQCHRMPPNPAVTGSPVRGVVRCEDPS